VSPVISEGFHEKQNLGGATVNAPGAKRADRLKLEILAFLVVIGALFLAGLYFSRDFRESILESLVLIGTVVTGVVILFAGMMGVHWFTSGSGTTNATAARVVVALLIVVTSYMFPFIVLALAIFAGVGWLSLNTNFLR